MYKVISLGAKSKTSTAAQFPMMATTLQEQKDGSFLLGLLFAEKSLLSFRLDGSTLKDLKDLPIENEFGEDYLGVTGGLRGTSTGDTAFATLHKGGGGLMGIFKKAAAPQNEDQLWEDLGLNKGSFGFSYKHSIVQIINGNFKLRKVKESSALLDAAHIGDFIFGLAGNCIFREPYLNPEKRYFLREDLEPNFRFHKVENGVFWLVGSDLRLMKLGLTDNKALPTTKKVPGAPLKTSADCPTDGWLYAIAEETLFRVRVNPENRLDELQVIKKFEGAVPLSIAVSEQEVGEGEPRKARIWVSVAKSNSTELYSFDSTRPEDMEELPSVPELRREWESNDIQRLSNLVYSHTHGLVGTCKNAQGEVQLFLQND